MATKEKIFTDDELMKPTDEEVQKTVDKTRKQLEDKLNRKIKTAYSGVGNKNVTPQTQNNSRYIRYTPANSNTSHASGSDTRIIRMVDVPKDPLEPPKFKHKKIPMGPSSPPVPILHSPTKKLSKDERDLWRIPPCISNWKNNKGYMIPLDKRVASDGRGLQEVVINDAHSKLAQSLYSAERSAREMVAVRNAFRRKLQLSEQEQREEELKKTAAEARMKRMQIQNTAEETETEEETKKRIEREKIRENRRKEREREHRLENKGGSKKISKITRDKERDISEKLALGMVVPKTTEALYDTRLFNQTQGLDSGFGDEEDYNIYDKSLHNKEREAALYRAPKRDEELYGEKISMEKIINTSRFKPDKDFEGVDREVPIEPRSGPVQFEVDQPQLPEDEDNEDRKDDEKEEDVYGFDKYFSEAKTDGKPRGNSRLQLGVMHAAAGGGVGSEMSNSRRNMNFVPSSGDNTKKYKSRSRSRSPPKRRKSHSPSPPKRKRSSSPPRRRISRSPKRKRTRSRSPRRNDRRDRRR